FLNNGTNGAPMLQSITEGIFQSDGAFSIKDLEPIPGLTPTILEKPNSIQLRSILEGDRCP
ncbi:MAG: hypothetical protein R3B95_15870, partial [Nitrospirales bacterium]|nr:hypothetical protein [Nitrospirales bacterium]